MRGDDPRVTGAISFCTPSRVLLADGARRRVAALCARQGWRYALIVTDRFFTEHTPWVRELEVALEAHGIRSSVFAGGAPDPSVALCDAATRALRASGAHDGIDHLIALGGGSNIDLAKALSLTLRFDAPAESFVGMSAFPGRPLPLVALPTTAGAGSEITPGAILARDGASPKIAIMGNDLRPAIAVIDPEFTHGCPPRVTADAGLDALTHAIESWLALDAADFDTGGDPDPGYSGRNPLTTVLAREGVRLSFQHLHTAWSTPNDRAARLGMATASLFASLSYASAGLHAVHGLAYALAGRTHDTHGSTNAVFLPYVMDALCTVREPELAEIARLAGEDAAVDSARLARRAGVATRRLIDAVGGRTTLPAFGIARSDLPVLLREGLGVTRLARGFPLQPCAPVYQDILEAAYTGRLEGA